MAKSKSELMKIRDETYCEPDHKRCSTCQHCWMYFLTVDLNARCQAIEIRGKIQQKDVFLFGVCDLWEPRDQQSGGAK
jgi:hypothetical protein